jgi:glycosyltransferase involved in cell wall biosynthesis
MRVLLSAIACHPTQGSEPKVGWDAAMAISALHECHVVTHVAARRAIEQKQSEGVATNVKFHYFGEHFTWHPSRFVARLQSWLIFRKWQARLLPFAAELHRQHDFHLTHHLTYVTWRVASPLWRLPIPFVWGPIGGTSNTPARFLTMLSPGARVFELFRYLSGLWASRSHDFKNCARNATLIVAAESQTATFMERHIATASTCTLCPVFFSEEQIGRFSRPVDKRKHHEQPLRVFAGGNMEGRKGISMALQAIAALKEKGISLTYTLGGGGPELQAMQELAANLGIADVVTFHNGYSGREYAEKLRDTDVYLLPSVRETAGITMMEAVLAGCYPIVLANTGAGEIVEQVGGRPLRAGSPAEAVELISQELEWCHKNRPAMASKAADAGAKLRILFSEEHYLDAISRIYAEAVRSYPRSR